MKTYKKIKLCEICKDELPLKVLKTPTNLYYLGYFCPNCGPYERVSGYYTKTDAEFILNRINTNTENGLIRCRQCGNEKERNLYLEDFYHDVTCGHCGARSGKYGDENNAIDLWNGKGVKFYVVVLIRQLTGVVLELWDSKEKAYESCEQFNKLIMTGGGENFQISDRVIVQEIEPNIPFSIEYVKYKEKQNE